MSKRKLDSARTNGAKSHGPKSDEGRKKSAMNAVTHGLYAANVLLEHESKEQHSEMLDAYIRQFQPSGQAEFDLVEDMVAAKWRQRRLWAIEASLFELEMMNQEPILDEKYSSYDEITHLSYTYRALAESPVLPFLTRHEARLERAYSRALTNLLELQHLRKSVPDAPKEKLQERTQSQIQAPPDQPAAPPGSPVFPPPTTQPPPTARLPAEPT
jgi:hypothetical protein